jgi:multiple sugar transport system substrate-binding protein
MEDRFSRRAFLAKGAVAAGVATLAAATARPAFAAERLIRPLSTITSKPVTLQFWTISFFNGRTGTEANGKPQDYYDWQIAQYQKLHPNVTINVTFIPSTFEGWAKFDAAVAAGQAPDVMWGQAGNQWKYAPIGAVEAFNGHMSAATMNEFLPALHSMITYVDGKTYLWPYGIALAGGVFINTDIVKEQKATSLLPSGSARSWTTNEFLALARATTYGSGSSQVYGTAFMTDWSYQLNQFLYGFGANLYNANQTKMVANTPQGAAGLQWLVDLEHKYKVAAPGSAGRQNSEVLQLFLQQRIAIYPSQPYYVTAFELQPQLKPPFNWIYVQPPHNGANPIGAEANVHGYLVAKQSDQAKAAVAFDFVKFLTRPEALTIMAQGQGLIPPVTPSIQAWAGTDPSRLVQKVIIDHAKPWGRLYTEIGPQVWTPMYDSAFSLQKTPAVDLNQAVQAGDQIIDQYAQRYHWPM